MTQISAEQKKRGRPVSGEVQIRKIRVKLWDQIPAKNKSAWINQAISEKLMRDSLTSSS